MSLNVPAIAVLGKVGVNRLSARLSQTGAALVLPKGEAPGLAMGLGGVGIRLSDLVMLYSGLARLGAALPLDRAPEATAQIPTGCLTQSPPGMSAIFCSARRRRTTRRMAASPSRPEPRTAIATPGQLGSTAA